MSPLEERKGNYILDCIACEFAYGAKNMPNPCARLHKTESLPDQQTASKRAYKTPCFFILQGTNTLPISLSFYQGTNIP